MSVIQPHGVWFLSDKHVSPSVCHTCLPVRPATSFHFIMAMFHFGMDKSSHFIMDASYETYLVCTELRVVYYMVVSEGCQASESLGNKLAP